MELPGGVARTPAQLHLIGPPVVVLRESFKQKTTLLTDVSYGLSMHRPSHDGHDEAAEQNQTSHESRKGIAARRGDVSCQTHRGYHAEPAEPRFYPSVNPSRFWSTGFGRCQQFTH